MEEILLSIDVFDENQLSGWCARKIGNAVLPLPIMVEYGDNCHLIKTFYKRNDLIEHGLGNGVLAFKIMDAFSHDKNLRISELQTGMIIWNDRIYGQSERFIRIPLQYCLNNVINPESCLINGICRLNSSQGIFTESVVYRTEIVVKGGRLYYFQVLDWPDIIYSLSISYGGKCFSKHIFSQISNMLLAEFWSILPEDINYNVLDIEILQNASQGKVCKIHSVKPDNNIIFIASSQDSYWLRNSQLPADSKFGNLYIDYPGDVILENPTISLPSIIECRQENLGWYSGYAKGLYINNNYQIKNIFKEVKPFTSTVQPRNKGMAFYLKVYRDYGPEALIEALYINYLARGVDKEGLKNNLAFFLKRLEAGDELAAIKSSIATIKNSAEYKSLNSRKMPYKAMGQENS